MSGSVRALSAFVKGQASAASLLAALEPSVVLSEERDGATRVDYTGAPIPHVAFTRADVARVLDRAIGGEMTIDDMSRWANLITLLDFFDLQPDGEDSDEVWDVLDRMAHPRLSGLDDAFKLRGLRGVL